MGPLSSTIAADRLQDQLDAGERRRQVVRVASATATSSSRPCSPASLRTTTPTARSCSARSRSSTRSAPRRRQSPRQRHGLRPRVVSVHDRPGPGRARREPDRRRDGVRQHRRRGRRGAAVRRRQALRLRPRARQVRRRRVRQQEADPRRLSRQRGGSPAAPGLTRDRGRRRFGHRGRRLGPVPLTPDDPLPGLPDHQQDDRRKQRRPPLLSGQLRCSEQLAEKAPLGEQDGSRISAMAVRFRFRLLNVSVVRIVPVSLRQW